MAEMMTVEEAEAALAAAEDALRAAGLAYKRAEEALIAAQRERRIAVKAHRSARGAMRLAHDYAHHSLAKFPEAVWCEPPWDIATNRYVITKVTPKGVMIANLKHSSALPKRYSRETGMRGLWTGNGVLDVCACLAAWEAHNGEG